MKNSICVKCKGLVDTIDPDGWCSNCRHVHGKGICATN